MKVITTAGKLVPIAAKARERITADITNGTKRILELNGESTTDKQKGAIEQIQKGIEIGKQMLLALTNVEHALCAMPEDATVELTTPTELNLLAMALVSDVKSPDAHQ